MLEREYPSLSVFSPTSPFPLPDPIPSQSIPKILSMAQVTLENRPDANGTAPTAAGSLLEDGSSADPASLLQAIMMAERSVGNEQRIRGIGFGDAAIAQLRYTLEEVPRVSILQETRNTPINSIEVADLGRHPPERSRIVRTKSNYGPTRSLWSHPHSHSPVWSSTTKPW